jgi:hypothetical protein
MNGIARFFLKWAVRCLFGCVAFDKLSALQFDGYEDMTVSKFQNKIWELADTSLANKGSKNWKQKCN